MLPTKGYFQDIECPFNNSSCGRPYCHFRHRKKQSSENGDSFSESEEKSSATSPVPTYKPTPKSELANIQKNKSHIPISYVPDIGFRSDRTFRPPRKITNITYKPTPISVLSSATNQSTTENKLVGESAAKCSSDSKETAIIDGIKQDIEKTSYNPLHSDMIDFEVLNNEFELMDELLTELKEDKGTNNEKIEDSNNVKEKSDKGDTNRNKERDKSHSSSSKKSHKSHKSSRDRHKKDEKSDSRSSKNKSDKDKEKSKHSSSSSSSSSRKSSHKSKDRSKDSKRDRDKNKDKDRHSKSKDSPKKSSSKNKDLKESSSSKDKALVDLSDIEMNVWDDPMNDDLDFEEDEDQTMMECYKIFNEYKADGAIIPTASTSKENDDSVKPESDVFTGKKRVAHAPSAEIKPLLKERPKFNNNLLKPGQVMTNRFKIAQAAQAGKEQENIIKEIKESAVKRPASSLLETARQIKQKKLEDKPKSTNLIDDILNETAAMKTATSINNFKPLPRKPGKIAPVSNVFDIQKAKARIAEMTKARAASQPVKTVAQTQKGGRVAHVPEFSLSDIPDVLNAVNSKLPVNVRTRFLTMIADECGKLYLTKEDAYTRALNEEFACYEKCKALATYRNSAMLAVNRLRKEIQEREKQGLGPMESGEAPGSSKQSDFRGRKFYDNIKAWMLSDEELDIHGYPKESKIPGRAVIKNLKVSVENLDDNERRCVRCHKIYTVDDDGWPLVEEECIYHPLKKRTIRGEQTYLCCRSSEEGGCATSDTHVSEFTRNEFEGFQNTMRPDRDDDPRSYAVYALDCEMCYTTKGLELTRVTIVDPDCKTVYESLVKPLNPIIDYNTRFSGITKDQMDKTSTSILQIQANILHLCNSKTILIGHSLESDMKALKIVHKSIIDTSVLFPHKMGLPHKRALKVLASEYLKKIIQDDVGGHDSAEDAITCMELVKWKLKEELKVRSSSK